MKYKTKHRGEVLACFDEAGHKSAKDVVDLLEKRGYKVGKATVYRQLESLVEEGILLQSTAPGHGSCFELNPAATCDNVSQHKHYHARCEKCGELIHIECHEIDELCEHLQKSHGFALDVTHLVLQGHCKKCQSLSSNTKGNS